MPKHFTATVDVLVGNRIGCAFVAAAGLGLSGYGYTERMHIDYKPGEVVDEARVNKALEAMIAESDRTKSDFKILSYNIVSITETDTP